MPTLPSAMPDDTLLLPRQFCHYAITAAMSVMMLRYDGARIASCYVTLYAERDGATLLC